jgi:hypothetical protein
MRRLLFPLVFLMVTGCRKTAPSGMTLGTLSAGVGCGNLLIEVSPKTVFQPVNLDAFPAVTQKPGQQVLFTYTVLDDGTTCMDGPVIHLISIRND